MPTLLKEFLHYRELLYMLTWKEIKVRYKQSVMGFLWAIFLLLLVMITTSVAVLLACANLFFRDVKYIVEVVLTYGILFTPVFYSAEMFGKWKPLLLLNPMGAVLETLDSVVVLHRAPESLWLCYAALLGVAGMIISGAIFKTAEPLFAQEI